MDLSFIPKIKFIPFLMLLGIINNSATNQEISTNNLMPSKNSLIEDIISVSVYEDLKNFGFNNILSKKEDHITSILNLLNARKSSKNDDDDTIILNTILKQNKENSEFSPVDDVFKNGRNIILQNLEEEEIVDNNNDIKSKEHFKLIEKPFGVTKSKNSKNLKQTGKSKSVHDRRTLIRAESNNDMSKDFVENLEQEVSREDTDVDKNHVKFEEKLKSAETNDYASEDSNSLENLEHENSVENIKLNKNLVKIKQKLMKLKKYIVDNLEDEVSVEETKSHINLAKLKEKLKSTETNNAILEDSNSVEKLEDTNSEENAAENKSQVKSQQNVLEDNTGENLENKDSTKSTEVYQNWKKTKKKLKSSEIIDAALEETVESSESTDSEAKSEETKPSGKSVKVKKKILKGLKNLILKQLLISVSNKIKETITQIEENSEISEYDEPDIFSIPALETIINLTSDNKSKIWKYVEILKKMELNLNESIKLQRMKIPGSKVKEEIKRPTFTPKYLPPKGYKKPHIIFILADDLGFNDVSFNGMSHIPTPNIDALAYSGIVLNRYYTPPICTPSRAALMTGMHPIHTGMQQDVILGCEPWGLPLEFNIMPEYFGALGYRTHMVGKWHLGYWKKVYTPTYRGFESHYGLWSGHHDYYDHTATEGPYDKWWGLDMRRNMEVDRSVHGQYSTDLFTKEAVKVIQNHHEQHSSESLFLYISHTAVHSGNVQYNLMPAPEELVQQFENISDYYRRKFGAMLTKLDESVGQVVQALNNMGMLEQSVIVFSSDNGGAPIGMNKNAGSNYPLRGVKNTLWEGGVRGAAFVWSPLLKNTQRVSSQLMHIEDWLPTLYYAAGGETKDLGDIDGKNMWRALSNDFTPRNSPRKEILHNIDDQNRIFALTLGQWKIISGSMYGGGRDSWYGPSGREVPYNYQVVKDSSSYKILHSLNLSADVTVMKEIRNKTQVKCTAHWGHIVSPCDAENEICLFNIVEDPCEQNNLAQKYPRIMNFLLRRVKQYNTTARPPENKKAVAKGAPELYDYVWTNFGDYDEVIK